MILQLFTLIVWLVFVILTIAIAMRRIQYFSFK